MSDGFHFRANHRSAPVTVDLSVGWAETATLEQVQETLTYMLAEAFSRADKRFA